jgi:ribose 5-phosphate isomerase B
MKAVIGADHGGVELKSRIIQHLQSIGWEVSNMGVDTEESVHYPDIALATCTEFLKGEYQFGILVCGTGIGMSITANKLAGIRCANLCSTYAARMAKAHNNANFISFGGRMEYGESVTAMIDSYLAAEFDGGRHLVRVDKINALDR